ncbi:MAG: hypothetical protein WCW77_01660 [Patescibacteria group bacterium]|jgi:hypothetical protein
MSTENFSKKFKIGVFGSAAGSNVEELKPLARKIGEEIAKRGGILISGATRGLPYEAAMGAAEEGGMNIGFSPAISLDEHVDKYKNPVEPYILVLTGMGQKGRNMISCRTCDAGIFISGRTGTMNEFTILYDDGEAGNVIGFLKGSGGVVDEYLINFTKTTEKPSQVKIVIEEDPAKLVEKIFEALDAGEINKPA